MRMLTALHTIQRPDVVLEASPNRTSSRHIRGCHDGPTRDDDLSRLIYIWSLAPVEADAASAAYDMAAQCGAGGQPKSDLLKTHTRLS
jgi:hypothetical protein